MVIVFVLLVLSSLYFELLFNIIVGLRFIYSRYTLTFLGHILNRLNK
jgi:hypothetical protein